VSLKPKIGGSLSRQLELFRQPIPGERKDFTNRIWSKTVEGLVDTRVNGNQRSRRCVESSVSSTPFEARLPWISSQ
jgi:hypothetical protein